MNVYRGANGVKRPTPKVCVLGTGTMGAGMARNLVAAGLDTRAWNRTASRATPLAESGVVVCVDPSDAVRDADVVLTMLWDAGTVEDVLREAGGGWAPDAVLLQTSTVGVEGAARLAEVAVDLGLRYVDAPVQGTKQPAERGELVVLASGPEDCRSVLAPVVDAIGSRTLWLGEAGTGSRLKLATNAFVVTVTAALAESLSIASALGIEPASFLGAIAGGPLESPFVAKKAQAMVARDYAPAFTVQAGLKDIGLLRAAAADAGTDTPMTEAAGDRLEALVAQGHGDDDIAALGRRPEEAAP